MSEQRVAASTATTPGEWRRSLFAASAQGPTAIDDGSGGLYVLRYHEIERLLHDTRLRGIGLALFDAMGVGPGPLRDWYGGLMFTNDGPRHDRLRRLVSKAFTPRAVEQLRPLAAAEVDMALTALRRAGGGDLVAALGHVPMHVMCALVGVPAAAVPDFIGWVGHLSPTFALMDAGQIAAAERSIVALLAYVGDLVEQRSHRPADDLLSALIRAEHEGDRLTRDETVAMVANLLVGGHDTTASQIGCTALATLSRPETLAAVRAEPALASTLLSETIRFEPSIAAAPRTAAAPIEIGGIERPAGTIVMCCFLTAHRDPEVWHDPDAFLPRRFAAADAPRLLSFGAGPHYCLGAALARLTLEETVRGLAELSPRLTVDPGDVEWCQVLGQSPVALPVAV